MATVTQLRDGAAEKNKIIWPVIIGLFYVFSTVQIAPFYYGGDQLQYSIFYESAVDMDWADSYEYYQSVLGSKEPIYFLLVKLSAPFLERVYFSSVLNGILAGLIYYYFSLFNVALIFRFIFSVNFYLLVLLFAAERLKLGFIFLSLAFLWGDRVRLALLGISILAHTQIGLLVVGFYLANAVSDIKRLNGRMLLHKLPVYLIVLATFAVIIQYQKGHIDAKVQAYLGQGGVLDVLKVSVFLILAAILSKRHMEPLIVGLPTLIAAYYLGSERIAILSYLIFLYYGLQYRRGFNFFVVGTAIYFAWKGWMFIFNVINYGQGFIQ